MPLQQGPSTSGYTFASGGVFRKQSEDKVQSFNKANKGNKKTSRGGSSACAVLKKSLFSSCRSPSVGSIPREFENSQTSASVEPLTPTASHGISVCHRRGSVCTGAAAREGNVDSPEHVEALSEAFSSPSLAAENAHQSHRYAKGEKRSGMTRGTGTASKNTGIFTSASERMKLIPCFKMDRGGARSSDSESDSEEISRNANSTTVTSYNVSPTGDLGSSSSCSQLPQATALPYPVHTQVEYRHYLVPDLDLIMSAPYYWGVMDRYEAEALLEGKPEGTFILRDSAQSEYLFSVSFRRYSRTMHARIEQKNHKFSFDCYDPSIFNSDSIIGLIEHYKNPAVCLFFEPQLSRPLRRNFVFPLDQLCKAAISASLNSYDSIQTLLLPNALKESLKVYHYKQPVRTHRLD